MTLLSCYTAGILQTPRPTLGLSHGVVRNYAVLAALPGVRYLWLKHLDIRIFEHVEGHAWAMRESRYVRTLLPWVPGRAKVSEKDLGGVEVGVVLRVAYRQVLRRWRDSGGVVCRTWL